VCNGGICECLFFSLTFSFQYLAEADVHTATPTIGNAAATWAGWAVSAVSAKFYRSQSDTRPRPPLTGKNLSKPASLGMSMLACVHRTFFFHLIPPIMLSFAKQTMAAAGNQLLIISLFSIFSLSISILLLYKNNNNAYRRTHGNGNGFKIFASTSVFIVSHTHLE
jgi:hypothetical protein